MPANLQEAIPYILFGIALAIALFIIIRASRRTTVVDKTEGDVLDEGAAPASRNQALIDAPEAAQKDGGTPLETATPEPVAAAPEPAPAPAPTPSPTPAPAADPSPSGDDLTNIKGLGPKLAALLAEQGITSFAQIAAWSDADVERIDASLGRFSGRITRDQWVEQAKFLAAGDQAGFAAKFGQNT